MLLYFIESFDLDVKNKQLRPSMLPEFKDKKFIVMVKADWCGHCQHASPEFEKAAEIMKNDNNVLFCYADITGDTAEEKEISKMAKDFFDGFRGFPNISVFKNGKEIKKHSGQRDAETFISLVKNA